MLGAGGFVSGPGGVAAWLTRRPLVIHEQNAVAGMTNRMLARLARRVLEAFPASFPPSAHAERVGNPVRREIAALAPPAQRFAERRGPLRVLVFGGSQGAARLNAVVPAALAMIDAASRPHRAFIRRASGTSRRRASSTRSTACRPTCAPSSTTWRKRTRWADLVVCRSGALTVSELAAAGLPAMFVPFAAAVDDHQTLNAKFLVDAQAGGVDSPKRN